MSSERAEVAIIVLVLAAVGGVLLAPIVGRAGSPSIASAIMLIAASCGAAAFGVAAIATWQALRHEILRGGRGGDAGGDE